MNIRTAASWVLIIFALGIAFYMFFLPALKPPIPETIQISELVPAGKNDLGVDTYWRFKDEVQDWVKILGQLSPVLAMILAYITKRKENEPTGR
ncbi:unnamed protein product [marine sediment metagenome]|uniref:Uncharacterized protein n=1 Tax=marine sediment metagenome TaxID=412755 RepID=X1VHK5_9ZZZZ